MMWHVSVADSVTLQRFLKNFLPKKIVGGNEKVDSLYAQEIDKLVGKLVGELLSHHRPFQRLSPTFQVLQSCEGLHPFPNSLSSLSGNTYLMGVLHGDGQRGHN